MRRGTSTGRWLRALRAQTAAAEPARPAGGGPGAAPELEIAADDPLLAHLARARGTVELGSLDLDSPALAALRAEGTHLVVPLISHGELIGMLRLGPRRSEQGYSHDDRKLLDGLAAHAAPAVRVAQLVRQQQAEIRQRERIEQELQVAQLIQQQFLPRELPELPGWRIATYYRAARAVGGDFYDFIELPDGNVGIVVGDVSDKGVPAALVMATTHSIFRGEAPRLVSPSAVLGRANELLRGEMPPQMFVTCLYAVLDPASGRLRFANAGHNLPVLRAEAGVTELRATGMPLGLLPGMAYDENEVVLAPGDRLLLYSDGLAEAHAPDGEMFGFPRLLELCDHRGDGEELIELLLAELSRVTGPEWEQEDDITLVTLDRAVAADELRVLDEFEVPSEAGVERAAAERVVAAAAALDLPAARVEALRTAVAEAVMNAVEHGNQGRPELPIGIRVTASAARLEVAVTDQGGAQPIPEPPEPDLKAKLAGLQSPRGWGLLLIHELVDDVRTSGDGWRHTIHLGMHTPGAATGG